MKTLTFTAKEFLVMIMAKNGKQMRNKKLKEAEFDLDKPYEAVSNKDGSVTFEQQEQE